MCGFIRGGGVHGFFSFFGYNEIRSMSGRYASYWNAFLFLNSLSFPGFYVQSNNDILKSVMYMVDDTSRDYLGLELRTSGELLPIILTLSIATETEYSIFVTTTGLRGIRRRGRGGGGSCNNRR